MTHGPTPEARGTGGRAAAIRWSGLAAAVACLILAGCGGSEREPAPLGFIELTDSTGVAAGPPMLRSLEPYRLPNGAVRVRGTIDLPDRTRLQLTLRRKVSREIVGRVHVLVEARRFDSSPILGPTGPLPKERYQVEALTFFNDMWQEPSVLRETEGGRRLRGAGITRDGVGAPAFRMVAERDL